MWSVLDCEGRTIWIADAHRGDGKRFVVRADEKLTAFVELESAISACDELIWQVGEIFAKLVSLNGCRIRQLCPRLRGEEAVSGVYKLAVSFVRCGETSPRLELALVLVRFDRVARFIINAYRSVMWTTEKLRVADCVVDCVWFAVPQATEGVCARSDSSVTFAVQRAHRSGCRYCWYENYKVDARSRFSFLHWSICLSGTAQLLIWASRLRDNCGHGHLADLFIG
jgi:hypothetical protein